jgi:hypothetical protein
MDTAIRLPGGYRIGLDGIVGLIPDWATVSGHWSPRISSPRRQGCASTPILIRMVSNVAIEAVVGLIPILGDLFDIAWKANVRNLALLDAHLRRSR